MKTKGTIDSRKNYQNSKDVENINGANVGLKDMLDSDDEENWREN